MQTIKTLENINLCNDCMFKAVFRSKEARSLVIDFISSITGIKKEVLKNATFNGGEIVKSNINEKKKESDIIISISDDRKLIVEMNGCPNPNIFEKNSQYAFSIINETTKSNKRYSQVILINLDNFNKYNTHKPILTFKIRDEEGNIENELYTSIHLILENVVNKLYNKNIKKEIVDFCRFLKVENISDMKKLYEGDERYMAAFRKVEDLSTDPEFIGYYDVEEAHRQDLEDAKEYAIKEGLEQGLQQGIEQGLEQGIKQGIEQGELNKQLEIAKKMLSKKMSNIDIVELTGLSFSEVEKIKAENF